MDTQYVSPPQAGEAQPELGDAVERVLAGLSPRPEVTDPFSDDKKLLDFYTKFKTECTEDRTTYEREWWKKLMYTLGQQWIYYDQKRGQWTNKRLTKWTPKPVTNVVAETVDTIKSVFNAVMLSIVARPSGQDPRNVATAELADELEPCIQQEHGIKEVMWESDFWLATLHSVFWHVWWDKRAETNGTLIVPHETCLTCGKTYPPDQIMQGCPVCGTSQFKPAIGPDGQEVGDQARIGKGATDVLSPLEVLVPPTHTWFSQVPGLIRQRWRTTRWWKDHYPEFAKTLTFSSSSSDRSLQLFRSLATQTDIAGSPMSMGGGGSESGAGSEGCPEYELWYKPCDSYPDGLFMRVAGDTDPKIVRDPSESTPGPLPYTDSQGRRIFPWLYQRFSRFGGRFWGRGPLDLILQKQDQINQIDALIQLIIQRVANPIWLKPKGAEVQSFTGEPGLVVEWNPLAAGGAAKPERIPGENVPPSLMQIRAQLMEDIVRLAGTFDVLRGAKPAGVEAFSALQLLVERAQSRFGGALAERGECYRQWYSIALELERQYGPQERTWSIMGPNRRWSIKHFLNADLQGAVEIVVEDGSQMPKTNLGKRAAIEQANQLRMIDAKDPDQRYAIFRDFGITHLLPGLDASVKSALQEQDEMERWVEDGMPPSMDGSPGFPMKVKPWHDDAVHLTEHRKWANGDRVRQMLTEHPDVEAGLRMHFDLHERQAMMKELPPGQRAQMQAGQGLTPGQELGQMPKPPQAQGGALAMAGSNRESGNPADIAGGAQAQQPGAPQGPM